MEAANESRAALYHRLGAGGEVTERLQPDDGFRARKAQLEDTTMNHRARLKAFSRMPDLDGHTLAGGEPRADHDGEMATSEDDIVYPCPQVQMTPMVEI